MNTIFLPASGILAKLIHIIMREAKLYGLFGVSVVGTYGCENK